MLSDLIINAAILISFLSIANQFYKDRDKEIQSRFLFKICTGLVCGILGILLMWYSVRIQNVTLVDFRNIATLLATTVGGSTAAVISGIAWEASELRILG
ncbi:LytS/YhcK type 5TM receptor domain-containing protein [Ruminiclostridium josui]|uniref:LytS/YhcK type 5TM receptor domain-containing protein n=1 Tax=Ruminiclostridium josui TaxID=1499 RepID=UPI000A4F2D0F|nr:LytS/YhcK type 5TM receptor domain-containing protein [Ruminiclostridium josui]